MLIIFAGCMLELLMFESGVWKVRKILIWLVALINIMIFGLMFLQGYSLILIILLCYIFLFRIINYLRIIKGRTSQERLKSAGFKSSLFLGLCFIIISGVAQFFKIENFPIIYFQYAQLIASLAVACTVSINIYKLSRNTKVNSYLERDLPTVSICIPARNETEQMEICINSLLASTYPKLEVIVLDDCSTDKTSEIIKKFAHDGVRFIKGDSPENNWLPKNQAYQKLLDNAMGEIVLFCGVDTRFAPHTITKLVSLLLTKNLHMISVLPIRVTSSNLASLIQPMRYWWELALPRDLFKSPPVLSTCWVANRHELIKIGGFKAAKNSVLPERQIAKRFYVDRKYTFIKTTDLIDVQTVKPISDQRDTAIRVRYPQVRKRPELVMILLFFHLTVLLMPYALIIYLITTGNILSVILAGVIIVINLSTHISIMYVSNPSSVPIALINYPFVIIAEIIIGLISMYKYEFSEVKWKERNICIPVMQVTPKLPHI